MLVSDAALFLESALAVFHRDSNLHSRKVKVFSTATVRNGEEVMKLRAQPAFHGMEAYSDVAWLGGDGKVAYGRLVLLFEAVLGFGARSTGLGLVRRFTTAQGDWVRPSRLD